MVIDVVGGKCRITIRSKTPREITMESWFDIYLDAAIANGMCVRFGKNGVVNDVGKSKICG